jgi:hypothetical protein
MQLLELAHVTATRRVLEMTATAAAAMSQTDDADSASELEDASAMVDPQALPPEQKDRVIISRMRRAVKEAGGDAEAVVAGFREGRSRWGHLGDVLQQLPSAQMAVDTHLAAGARSPCFHSLDAYFVLPSSWWFRLGPSQCIQLPLRSSASTGPLFISAEP